MPTQQEVQAPNHQTVYLLCEEYENDDGIREFSVLATANTKAGLQQLLQAKVEKDEYGFFAENGINDQGETYCSSNFEAGFVSYYIREETILDQEAIEQLLQTTAYNTTFFYPENLPDIMKMTIKTFGVGEGCPDVDPGPVIDALLKDKVFQALVKNAYWGSDPFITTQRMPRATQEITYYLQERFLQDPDYFATTGGVAKCSYPENLHVLIIDTLYSVARENHLPVTSPEKDANKIIRNPQIRAYFSAQPSPILIKDTDAYNKAAALCYRVTQNYLLLPNEKAAHPPLESKVKKAISREGQGIFHLKKKQTRKTADLSYSSHTKHHDRNHPA